MSKDTIYREDAIKALNREKSDWNCDYNVPIDNCIKRLNKVKSADRPQGEWVRISSLYSLDRMYRCSVCGKVIDDMPMNEYYDPAYKGCPYCLTRMKGENDTAQTKGASDD